jgi:hypothetical protein
MANEPSDPTLEPGFFAVLLASASTLLSVYAFPAARSMAAESVARPLEQIAMVVSYAAAIVLVRLQVWQAWRLSRMDEAAFAKGWIATSSMLGLPLVALGFVGRPPSFFFSVVLGAMGALLGASAAWVALAKAHTRAGGLTLCLVTLTAFARLGAATLFWLASERTDPTYYGTGMTVISISLGCELLAVAAAALWLGTRAGRAGRIAINGALVVSVLATILTSGGTSAHGFQGLMQAALAEGVPSYLPCSLPSMGRFLSASSVCVGFAFLTQARPRNRVPGAVALLLLSRGAFDVPMRFLFASVAALTLVHASRSPKALWDELLSVSAKSRDLNRP